ncbi:MAG: tetratricopeptide repeat protein [Bacteroidaceae bacterium]|nr:tetratricopeptide repeat protein [Bacteroidaceae bacterium]
MKKAYLLFIALFAAISMSAQMQQGYVKTLGRPNKDGVPLKGVTVLVKGEHNTVLSKADGTFSMLMTGKKNGDAYSLQQVQKSGYELNEKGVIGRKYAFSDKVPLTLVMVSTSQLQADKQRIENKAYEVAQRNYQKKMAELERQLGQNTITAETYRSEAADLREKFERYQLLIDGLAEHYAHTDYDLLTDTEREINLCIEAGDLDRADSLIHTLFDPTDVLQRNHDALARLDQQIDQANDIIRQANTDMAAVLKQQEKDAEYLYQLYTIALAKYDNEKARYYIETRAALDTTSVDWQIDAGLFIENYFADYSKALNYYRCALTNTLRNPKYYYLQGVALNNIGDLLLTQAKYQEALTNFEKARDFDKDLLGEENVLLVKVYNNIGVVYDGMENYIMAWDNYNKALKIENTHHPDGSKEMALLYSNIGGLYRSLGEKDKAIVCYKKALELYRRFTGEQSAEVASVYGNLADCRTNNEEALQYVEKALDFYLKLYGDDHPNVAWCYGIMGSIYFFLNQPQKGEEYIIRALFIYKNFLGDFHPKVAGMYRVLSARHFERGNLDMATEYNQKALDIYMQTYGEGHSTVASCYIQNGEILISKDKIQEASTYIDKAINGMEKKYPEGHPDLYTYYLSQGCYRLGLQTKDSTHLKKDRALDGQMNDYGTEESFDKALVIAEKFYREDSERMQNIIQYLVNIYFIRIAIGGTAYQDKLKALATKYPKYVKTAWDTLQQQIP